MRSPEKLRGFGVIILITFIPASIGIRARIPLGPMANNEGMNQNPVDGDPRIRFLSKGIEVFHQESQLTMQGLQATLDRLADALLPPQALGGAPPPMIVVRRNPDFRKALPMANRMATPDDSRSSDEDLNEGFVRRPIHGGDHLIRSC